VKLVNKTAQNIMFSGGKSAVYANRIMVPAGGYREVDIRDVATLVLFDRQFQNQVASGNLFLDFGAPASTERIYLGVIQHFVSGLTDWSNCTRARYIYVSARLGGLHVVDASNLINPSVVTTYTGINADVSCLEVDSDNMYAYVCANVGADKRFWVLDVSDPLDIQKVGSGVDISGAWKIVKRGNLAYVSCLITNGIRIYDVSNPTNLIWLGFHAITNAYGHDVQGDYLYACNTEGKAGLFSVVDVSDPTNTMLVGTSNTITDGYNVCVHGSCAYVTDGGGGIKVYDVSNRAAPALVWTSSAGVGNFMGLFKAGNYLYITDYDHGIYIFDITNPTLPQALGSIPITGVRHVYVSGCYMYASGVFGLHIVDVSNPLSPRQISFVALSGFPYWVNALW